MIGAVFGIVIFGLGILGMVWIAVAYRRVGRHLPAGIKPLFIVTGPLILYFFVRSILWFFEKY